VIAAYINPPLARNAWQKGRRVVVRNVDIKIAKRTDRRRPALPAFLRSLSSFSLTALSRRYRSRLSSQILLRQVALNEKPAVPRENAFAFADALLNPLLFDNGHSMTERTKEDTYDKDIPLLAKSSLRAIDLHAKLRTE